MSTLLILMLMLVESGHVSITITLSILELTVHTLSNAINPDVAQEYLQNPFCLGPLALAATAISKHANTGC